jgi:ZIP family zinc transporter
VVLEAVVVAAAAQISLVLSGLVVYATKVPSEVVGAVGGFGAGALIGAIAFDLIPQGASLANLELSLWLLGGATLFVATDRFVESRFSGPAGGPEALGIVVGAVVDGIPESLLLGIQVALGEPLSWAFFAAVWVSNVAEALGPSAELAASGWKVARVTLMWASVVVACAVAAGLGYIFAQNSGGTGERAAIVAAGGLLAMLTDSLIPFSYERDGVQTGIWTVVGFAVSLALA